MSDKRRVARLDLGDDQPSPEPLRKRSGVRAKETSLDALVLVVDDDTLMREAMRRMVSRRHRAIDAPDAATAIALCVQQRPDVVVSDFDMPGANGRRLAELLTIALGDEAPPVIIVTGGDLSRAAGSGIVRVLPKPLGLDTLLDALDEALQS
jgi:DNA-binding NtrC family response regulator